MWLRRQSVSPGRAGTKPGLIFFFWVQIVPGFVLIRGNGKQGQRIFLKAGGGGGRFGAKGLEASL